MSTYSAHSFPTAAEIDAATDSALATLAWSTPADYETGDMLDGTDAEWSDAARETMRGLITDFLGDGSDDALEDALDGLDYGQIGHDFILTANRHGAGFWDRGRGDKGAYLTDHAHPFGEISAYLSTESNTLEMGY